jgi:hypothetical protein
MTDPLIFHRPLPSDVRVDKEGSGISYLLLLDFPVSEMIMDEVIRRPMGRAVPPEQEKPLTVASRWAAAMNRQRRQFGINTTSPSVKPLVRLPPVKAIERSEGRDLMWQDHLYEQH